MPFSSTGHSSICYDPGMHCRASRKSRSTETTSLRREKTELSPFFVSFALPTDHSLPRPLPARHLGTVRSCRSKLNALPTHSPLRLDPRLAALLNPNQLQDDWIVDLCSSPSVLGLQADRFSKEDDVHCGAHPRNEASTGGGSANPDFIKRPILLH